MKQVKRFLIAGGLATSVLAGGALFSARPAAADDWDHPVKRVVHVRLDDGTYERRVYYYDYNDHHYVPYSRWRDDYNHWYYSHDRHWRRHHPFVHPADEDND